MFLQSARTYLSGTSARLRAQTGELSAQLKARAEELSAQMKAWANDVAAEFTGLWAQGDEAKVAVMAISATLALSLLVGTWPFPATPAKAAPLTAAKTESVLKAVDTAATTAIKRAPASEAVNADVPENTDAAGGTSSSKALAGLKVVIDPGHGTAGSGASGYDSDEATNTLAIAEKLHDELTSEGAAVYMTRTGMYFPGNAPGQLSVRTAMANSTGADMFVSIHNNSADANHVANGAATYIAPQAGPSSASHQLAGSIQSALVAKTGLKDNGILKAPFYVTRDSRLPAAVLVEVGFVSNPSEAAALKDDAFRAKAAQGLAQGIAQYFQDR